MTDHPLRLLFVRFGTLPLGGRSRNDLTGEMEAGVSVYEAVERGGWVQLLVPSWDNVSVLVTMGGLMDAYQGRMRDVCPAFEVEGDIVGVGSDGEPLLAECQVVREISSESFIGRPLND